MATNGKLSQCLRVVVYFSLLGLVVSRAVSNTHYKGDPKNYNYHYEKSGAMLKTGGSDVPYLDSYEIDDGGYYPSDYTSAESSNFGSYDIGGGGGQYLGGGGGQYLAGGGGQYLGGGGYSGGLGSGGLNQYSNQGYSSGAGFGFGNGGGLHGGGLNSGFSGGYTSGVGNNYANQPGFQSGGGGGSGGGYIQRPFITGGGYGGGLHGGQVGGGYVDKNQFESDNKNVGNANSQLAQGQSGGSANQGNQGVNQGAALQSSAKVDSGYYKDETANKNQQGDGKSYQGGQNFDKSGKIFKSCTSQLLKKNIHDYLISSHQIMGGENY